MSLKKRIAHLFGYDLVKSRRNVHTHLDRHVARVLADYSVNCVIDVGANVGQYGESLRRAGYQGRLVSFEPLTESFAQLKELASDDAEWRCHNLALGAEAETRPIYRTEASVFSSFSRPSHYGQRTFHQSVGVVGIEHVQTLRLDDLFEEIVRGLGSPRVFLKIDTQGHDLAVFAGAQRSLEHICGLQSELSVVPIYENMPDYLEALALYRQHGFEVTGFYPIFRDKQSLIIAEFDSVLVRRDFPSTERVRIYE